MARMTQNRRRFLQLAAVAAGAPLAASALPAATDIRLGLFVSAGKDPAAALKKVQDLGLPTCQLAVEDYSPEMLKRVNEAMAAHRVEVTALGALGPGKMVWDFYQGPLTIGLVPQATRSVRAAHLKRAAEFAKACGISAIQTHLGFIPENPNDPVYNETVEAVRDVASHAKANGVMILCETGQESPVTLLRMILDVGQDNVFINLDTANLILYGKGNPLDALDVVGNYVRGIHAKDGLFPTDPKKLGKEVPIGEGKVDFPKLIKRLRELNYRGAMTIEREISGPRQIEDVKKATAYLQKLLG
jgi:L-ribulose-5-phosphate 3-epimerase